MIQYNFTFEQVVELVKNLPEGEYENLLKGHLRNMLRVNEYRCGKCQERAKEKFVKMFENYLRLKQKQGGNYANIAR